jgi:hypothetical protein
VTRRYLLVNAVTGSVIVRGTSLRTVRRQRSLWAEVYRAWKIPFVPRIQLAPRLALVDAARKSGCL